MRFSYFGCRNARVSDTNKRRIAVRVNARRRHRSRSRGDPIVNIVLLLYNHYRHYHLTTHYSGVQCVFCVVSFTRY